MSLKYLFFFLLPKNLISRLFGGLARMQLPLFSSLVRNVFIRMYKIDTGEAEKEVSQYATLHDFFIRRLRKDARPVGNSPLVSPVDGKLSQFGELKDTELFLMQAKGRQYSLRTLVPGLQDYSRFVGGTWATIYLAPWNYHRIHTPVSGEVASAIYTPGTLWPVNEWSVASVRELFCVNERLTTLINIDGGGQALVVKVGATNVGRITVSYNKQLVTNGPEEIEEGRKRVWKPEIQIPLEKGDELGCFELGSTVILVLDKLASSQLKPQFDLFLGAQVKTGQSLGNDPS